MRILLIVFVALVAAGGGGYYYWSLEQQKRAQAAAPEAAVVEAPKTREVYVPVEALFAGTIIKPEHLRGLPLEDAALSPEMIPADPEGEALLIGSVARQSLPAGVPIARSAVVQPGDRGFLAAVLPQGKRAISIPITEVAGVSGLVLPGDRVDIILTYSVTGVEIDGVRDMQASETVMSNIRVLALDQRLHQTEAASDGPPVASTPIARTATLQVSPREAEMLTLATTLGELSLVLNSVHDGGDAQARLAESESAAFSRISGGLAQPRRLTLDSDVTSLLLRQSGAAPERLADRNQRIQIVRGTTSGDIELGDGMRIAPPAAAEPGQLAPAGIAPDGAAYAGAPLEVDAQGE